MNIIQIIFIIVAPMVGIPFLLMALSEFMWGMQIEKATERQEDRIWERLIKDDPEFFKEIAEDLYKK